MAAFCRSSCQVQGFLEYSIIIEISRDNVLELSQECGYYSMKLALKILLTHTLKEIVPIKSLLLT